MALPNENKKPGQKTYVQPHRCRISQLYDLMPKKEGYSFLPKTKHTKSLPKSPYRTFQKFLNNRLAFNNNLVIL